MNKTYITKIIFVYYYKNNEKVKQNAFFRGILEFTSLETLLLLPVFQFIFTYICFGLLRAHLHVQLNPNFPNHEF